MGCYYNNYNINYRSFKIINNKNGINSFKNIRKHEI